MELRYIFEKSIIGCSTYVRSNIHNVFISKIELLKDFYISMRKILEMSTFTEKEFEPVETFVCFKEFMGN